MLSTWQSSHVYPLIRLPDHVFADHRTFVLRSKLLPAFAPFAAVAANALGPENLKCKPAGQGTSYVLIMHGTKDPLNPFDGGEVQLFAVCSVAVRSGHRESRLNFLRTSTT